MTDKQVRHDNHLDLLIQSVRHCIRTMPEFSSHKIRVVVPFETDPNVRETVLELPQRQVRVVFAPDDWLCGGPLEIVGAVENLMRRGLSELFDGGEVSMKSG